MSQDPILILRAVRALLEQVSDPSVALDHTDEMLVQREKVRSASGILSDIYQYGTMLGYSAAQYPDTFASTLADSVVAEIASDIDNVNPEVILLLKESYRHGFTSANMLVNAVIAVTKPFAG